MAELKKIFTDRIHSQKWIRVTEFLIFCFLTAGLLLKLTYLFRNDGYDRYNIVGFKEEKDLDVVYIGGSDVILFWQPPRVWKEYGIKSYNYATYSIHAESLKGDVIEVLKTQSPKLFIIDLRPFQYWKESYEPESGIRNITDSMDYSFNRFRMVHDYLSSKAMPKDADQLSYYLELVKYHSNSREVLSEDTHWKLIDNRDSAPYNGWIFTNEHTAFQTPTDFLTDERGRLEEKSEKLFIELLDYCAEKKLTVLFVVCPYAIQLEDQKLYNTMEDVIHEYGFDYLNANEYYEVMGIDYTRDFADINHTNAYGAEKYTHFLADYIQERYQLQNNPSDDTDGSWQEMYERFLKNDIKGKEEIDRLISEK